MNLNDGEAIGQSLFAHPVAEEPERFATMFGQLVTPSKKVSPKVFWLVDEHRSQDLVLTRPACRVGRSDPGSLHYDGQPLRYVVFDDGVHGRADRLGTTDVTLAPTFRAKSSPLRIGRVEVV